MEKKAYSDISGDAELDVVEELYSQLSCKPDAKPKSGKGLKLLPAKQKGVGSEKQVKAATLSGVKTLKTSTRVPLATKLEEATDAQKKPTIAPAVIKVANVEHLIESITKPFEKANEWSFVTSFPPVDTAELKTWEDVTPWAQVRAQMKAAVNSKPSQRTTDLRVAYSLAVDLLRNLVTDYSKPSFQRELQELCQMVEEEAVSRTSFPKKKSPLTPWQVIGMFVHEEEVLKQLAIIDELLNLPPNYHFHAISDSLAR